MRLSRFIDNVIAYAPAKINLFLEVIARRADGYHDIATLMVALRLYDTLVFREELSGEVQLTCNRADLTVGPDNLIVRAAKLLKERTGCQRGAVIRLVKRIPIQAGLGGGSSDAAAALAGLNVLWKLGVDGKQLALWGADLGSDVAFFFDAPAAWCTGRGEIVTPVRPGKVLDIVLASPPFGCNTGDVYRRVRVPERPVEGVKAIEAFTQGDAESLASSLFNRLQSVAMEVAPGLTTGLEIMAKAGGVGHMMSGSGSTLFALCRERREALALAATLSRVMPDYSIRAVRGEPVGI